MSTRDVPRRTPDRADEDWLSRFLGAYEPEGPVEGAPEPLEGPDLYLSLFAELANLGATEEELVRLDAAAKVDFWTALEDLKKHVATAERQFDERQLLAAVTLDEIRALSPAARGTRQRLSIRCDERRHSLGTVYMTQRGLFIHLKGDAQLVTSTFFDFGAETVDARWAKHTGALLAWELNPAAYWCTTGCSCWSPIAIDFRRVREALKSRARTVTTRDVAWLGSGSFE